MINPQKAVQWYKSKYSSIGEKDYDIYEKLKKWYPKQDFAENPFKPRAAEPSQIPTEQELEEKANPGFFKKLLTANFTDMYAGDSDWWAEAYNKSMAGTLHQLMHGEAKYDVEEVDRAWYDEAGQFFVGLLSPVDMLTFFGSAGVGSIAAKGITAGPLKNYAIKGLSKMLGKKGFENAAKTKFGRYLASSAAIQSGFSLGTYGAAGAALQDQAQQSKEIADGVRKDRDYLQTTWAATKHGTSSLILGAGAGFVTKGFMAPKYAKAKMNIDPLFANKVTRLTMNPVGQVVAEGTVFSSGQIAERALMGEDVDMDDFLSGIFMNTAIVGGLRASLKPLRMAENDVTRYKAAKQNFYKGILEEAGYTSKLGVSKEGAIYSEYNAIKNIENSYKDSGLPVPEEIISKKMSIETDANNTVLGLNAADKNLKSFNNLLEVLSKENISDLSKKDKAKILKDAGANVLTTYEFFRDMQSNREISYEVYKKQVAGDKPLTDAHKKQIDLIVDSRVKGLEDINFMINQGALNNPKASNKMKEVYGDGFEVSVRRIDKSKPIKSKGVSKVSVTKGKAKELEYLGKSGEEITNYEAIIASVKRDIKSEKDRLQIEYDKGNIPTKESGTLQNLQSQLKSSSMHLWSLKQKYQKELGIKSKPAPKELKEVEIIKEVTFEPVLKTPEGNEVKLASFFKGIKTEKEAKEIASALNNVYKKVITGEDIGINKALGIKEKNVEYIPIDPKTGKPQQKISSLGPKYTKKRGAESEVNKLVEQGKAVKPRDIGIEPGIEIANQASIKNILNEINEVAGEVSSSLKDKIITDKIEAERIADIEYKKMTPDAAFKTPEKFVNAVNRDVRMTSKKYEIPSIKFIQTVAKEAGIVNPDKFKLLIPKDRNMNDLRSFFITLKEFKRGDYFKKKADLEKINLIKKIEKKAYWDKALTQDYQRNILKNVINVEDGNILKASKKQLKQFDEFLFNFDNIKQDGIEWNILSKVVKNQDLSDVKTIKDFPEKALVLIKSQHEAISKLNAPEVSNMLREHFSIFNNNLEGLNNFRFQSERIIGKLKSKKILDEGDYNIVSGKGEKYLSEKNYIGNKDISSKDMTILKRRQRFFENAIKPEWFKTVGEKGKSGDGLASKNKDGNYKYLNLDTKEGQIMEKYVFHIQEGYGKNKFEQSIRRTLPDARAEYIIKENDIKWVSKNEIYMPEILTKDGLNYVNEKNFKSLAKKIATDMVQDELVKGEKFDVNKRYGNKSGEEIWEVSLDIARDTFDNYYSRGVTVGLSKHFKPKIYSYEPFIMNNKGKMVRAYEHTFDKTTKTQTRNMARDYATMEVAPDYLNLKGIKKQNVHNDIKTKLKKRGVKKDNREWILDLAERQLGYGNKEGGYFDILAKPVEGISRALSQTMLSLPGMPGIKAGLSGLSDALYIMRPMDMARGLVDIIRRDSNAYNKAVKANVFDIGLKDYTKKQWGDLVTKNLFRLGGMEPSDNFIRTWVIMSSKYHQQRQLKKIRNFPKNSKKYQDGYNTLKDFYFLTDKQISDAKKYSSPEKVLADNTLSKFDKVKKMRDIEIIEDKMNLYAHVNTQGSSSDLFMPKVATGKLIKPFLLFKRFAYASTSNLGRNIKLAGKHKNIFKPIIGTAGKFVTGSVMFSLYWNLFGRPIPDENSDWWVRFKNTLWRGEFLGILGDFMNPYNDGVRKITEPFNPAVVSWMGSMSLEVGQLIEGKATKEQTFEGLLKNTIRAYGGYRNFIDKRNNPLNRDKLRIKKLWSQFEEEVLKTPNVDAERSERTPYYIDLEKTFYLGTEEEYAKQLATTYIAIIHDEYRKTMDWDAAVKGAQSILKRKFTTMNPNKASLFKSSKKAKLNSLKFIKWLQKHPEAGDLTKRLFEVEAEYKKRLALYNSKVPYYWKQLNFSEMLSGFDWKTGL